jgi:hypothetical protein
LFYLLVTLADCFLHKANYVSAPPSSNRVRLVANIAFEAVWHKAEESCVFIGTDLLKDVLSKTKAEVKESSGGNEFVSENDVLVNWIYKVRFLLSSLCLLIASVFSRRRSITTTLCLRLTSTSCPLSHFAPSARRPTFLFNNTLIVRLSFLLYFLPLTILPSQTSSPAIPSTTPIPFVLATSFLPPSPTSPSSAVKASSHTVPSPPSPPSQIGSTNAANFGSLSS